MQIITISGRVGKDAETRTTGQGKDVTSFSVAVSEGRDKPTTWWDCAIWGNRGKSLQSHIKKGDSVTVVGRFETREHEGKTYLKCTVDSFAFGGKGGNSGGQSSGYDQASPSRNEAQNNSGFDDSQIPF